MSVAEGHAQLPSAAISGTAHLQAIAGSPELPPPPVAIPAGIRPLIVPLPPCPRLSPPFFPDLESPPPPPPRPDLLVDDEVVPESPLDGLLPRPNQGGITCAPNVPARSPPLAAVRSIQGKTLLPGSTKKPEDMYRIIEHFALGRKRLELFGEDHNIRPGWLTLGKGLSSSNFSKEAYIKNFTDRDGKVWQGSGGRNPPPDAPHLVVTTPEIESLRPKSPPHKNQQQQSMSANRRPVTNTPQNAVTVVGSETVMPPGWSSTPMAGFVMHGGAGPESNPFDSFGFSAPYGRPSGDHMDFDTHRLL